MQEKKEEIRKIMDLYRLGKVELPYKFNDDTEIRESQPSKTEPPFFLMDSNTGEILMWIE